jgi:N-acyl-D-amino-acid deacylase
MSPLPTRTRRFALLGSILLFSASCATGPAALPPSTPAEEATAAEPYDLIIENGRVVDGTGNAWFLGDVALRGDRIARVEPAGILRDAPARERIDATGRVVAPGFIDIQSHSRGALLSGDSRVLSKVTQGITTEILGEGTTNAPVNDKVLEALGVTPGSAAERRARAFEGPGGFDAWLRAMVDRGVSVNVGSYVGGGTIRVYGMGQEIGEAGPAELDSMRMAVRWAMEEGAFGIATALIYPPGNYASTRELIEISKVVGEYGGHYITHMRSEADRLLEATEEAIRIGREAGVPVEIYHLKAAGVRNHHLGQAVVDRIQQARDEGLDVQADMYPYVAGGTGLTACFPPWAAEGGRLYQNLANPQVRERIRAEILSDEILDWENLCDLATPENVLVLGLNRPETQRYAGMRLSDIAADVGKDWIDTAMDLLVAEGQRIGTIYFLMSEENVRLKLQQPWMKFGTDAGGMDPDSVTGGAHPRAYGTYPRILGKYVREEGVISLEEAVRKSSSAVATRLGIMDRGLLRPGMYADVVVFDPETIRDRSTFEDPHQLSVGVEHVFVNGRAVLRDGVHTGARPGRAVRGPGWRGADGG